MKRLLFVAIIGMTALGLCKSLRPSGEALRENRRRRQGHSFVQAADWQSRPLQARIRELAISRDKTHVAEVLEVLQHEGVYTRALAAVAAGRLAAHEARGRLREISQRREPDGFAARVALARLAAESGGGNCSLKVRNFLSALGISIQQINDLAGERSTSTETRALREIADLIAQANRLGERTSAVERQFLIEADYAAMLKVELSKMKHNERIAYLINNIRTLRPTHDRSYDAQALADEGQAALPAVVEALRDIHSRKVTKWEINNPMPGNGDRHLIFALQCNGDRRALSVLQEFVDQPGKMPWSGRRDEFVESYARGAMKSVKEGTKHCIAPDY